MHSGNLLVALRQPFPDDAREILIIVGGTCAVVGKTALFEFGEGKSSSSDGVILRAATVEANA